MNVPYPIKRTIVRINNIATFPILRLLAQPAVRLAWRIAPHRTVHTVAKLFITPPRFAHTASEKKLLAQGKQHVLTVGLHRLAVWQFGDKELPAVVLSHGWGGRGAQFQAFVPALLDAGFQVWLFDQIGHGFSEGKHASLIDFANSIIGLHRYIEQQGCKIHAYVSHSLGGASVATALRNGIAAERIVMIAPPSSLIRYSYFFAKHIGIPEHIRAAMQRYLERRYGILWEDFELPQAVNKIQTPALVIHDSDDHDVRIESGFAIARLWPQARFVRTERLGHRRILKDWQVIQHTVDFLLDRKTFPRPHPLEEWVNSFALFPAQ